MINNSSLLKLNNSDIIIPLIMYSAIYFVNPLIGIIFLSFYLLSFNMQNKKLFFTLYAFIALYFGLLNSTKVPQSDLINYKMYFYRASYTSFSNYISQYKIEIFYYAITYFLNKIFSGNFKSYIILITFIQYYLVLIAIHKFWKDETKQILLFAIFIYSLNNSVFGYSIHLLRQMTAASIFIYFFVEKTVNNRIKWPLIIIALLIHTSVGLLFLISFIPMQKKRLTIKKIIMLLILLIFILFFGSVLFNFLVRFIKGNIILKYILMRAQTLPQLEFSWYKGKGVNSIRILYFFFAFIPAVFSFFIKNCNNHYLITARFLFIYVLILESFVYNHLFFTQLRMSIYVLGFIPLALPTILVFFKQKSKEFVPIGMLILLSYYTIRFFNSFTITSVQKMASIKEILFNPVLFYLK
jgi:hypothetical protein